MAFGISLIYNFACAKYFDVGRSNILYSGCFFLAGGLVYLYRGEIAKLNQRIVLGIAGGAAVLYYIVGENAMMCLLVSSTLLIYAISHSGGVLENRVIKFFSSISMEIYLSHMVIFRAVEKLHLNTVLGDGWMQYVFTVMIVVIGASVFSVVMQRVIGIVEGKMVRHVGVRDEKKAGNLC